MILVFITGTAGSGKSYLTKAVYDWLAQREQDVITCNIDPGVASLPYDPDVDVRNYIDYQQIMEEYSLGPNGALILASDMLASRVAELQDEIDSLNSDYIIMDTPGQIELFAYRESGQYITRELRADSKVLLFLFDPALANTPSNFLSILLLYTSVAIRMKIPSIPVLTKQDIHRDQVMKIMRWCSNPSLFEESLVGYNGEQYALYSELFRTTRKLSHGINPYPVSSLTGEGMVSLIGQITRISSGGEEMLD